MIAEFEPSRWAYYYAYPFVTPEGKLLIFMGSSDDISQPPETFNLISTTLDGYERQNIRSDGYTLKSALWSPNGDGVIVVLAEESPDFQAGTVLWLSIPETPAVPLPIKDARNFLWGFPLNN